MLLFLVTLFTWYGKQQFNNPFAPVHRMVIAGNSGGLVLYFEQSLRNDIVHQLVINPDSCLPVDGQTIPLSDSWEYVSNYPCQKSYVPEHPPGRWYTLHDSFPNTFLLRKDWPEAHPLADTTLGATSLERVFPFKDKRNALYLQFSGTAILLIDDREFTCTLVDTTFFKEQLDMLIIPESFSDVRMERCRDVFRPRYTVISTPHDAAVSSFSNVYRFSSETIRYLTFRVQNDRLILVADTPADLH